MWPEERFLELDWINTYSYCSILPLLAWWHEVLPFVPTPWPLFISWWVASFWELTLWAAQNHPATCDKLLVAFPLFCSQTGLCRQSAQGLHAGLHALQVRHKLNPVWNCQRGLAVVRHHDPPHRIVSFHIQSWVNLALGHIMQNMNSCSVCSFFIDFWVYMSCIGIGSDVVSCLL